MPLKNGPREKLLTQGPEALKTEELLAIILRTGTKDNDVIHLSSDLFKAFDESLYKMSKGTFEDFKKIKGLGEVKIITLLASLELARRLVKEEVIKNERVFNTPDIVFQYCIDMQGLPQEVVRIIFLNSKLQLIASKDISKGSVSSSMAHPRDIFREAILRNASGIIMAHNHPSGDPTPSSDDVDLTKRIREAGKLLGIQLHDHIIIGKTYYSLRQKCKEIGWEYV